MTINKDTSKRFSVTIDKGLYAILEKRARGSRKTVSSYVAALVSNDANDTLHFDANMAARMSWVTYGMVLHIFQQTHTDPVFLKRFQGILNEESLKLFGPAPELPGEVKERFTEEDNVFVTDLFSTFERNMATLKKAVETAPPKKG